MLLIAGPIPLIGSRLWGIANGVWRRYERIVNKDHRIVGKKWRVPIAFHEFAQVVAHLVRPIGPRDFFLGDDLAVRINWRIPKPYAPNLTTLARGQLPEKIFMKSRFHRARIIVMPGH